MSRPRTMPEWMRWVERRLSRVESSLRGLRQVPVGGMMRWPSGALVPKGYLAATGGTFDVNEYPLLAELTGGNALPNPSPGTDGTAWIVRAE